MSPSLPPKANLRQLHNQAKDLLKAHKQGHASCCRVLRMLKPFEGKSDADILAGEVSLTETQYALAMDYGFGSWAALKRHVLALVPHDPRSSIRRENGRVWLDNVLSLSWNLGKMTTFCGALEASLAASPHPFSYDELMAFSGVAFRVRWHNESAERRWCTSCVVAEQPEEFDAIVKATGWPLPTAIQYGDPNPDKARIAAGIRAEIDAGRPVVAYDDTLNIAVAYGYTDDGESILFRTYASGDTPHVVPVSKLGPQQTFLGAHDPGSSLRAAASDGLALACRNWAWGRHAEGPAEYWYGAAAYDRWLEDLALAGDLDPHQAGALSWMNIIVFGSLADARKAAVRFLRAQPAVFEGESIRTSLARAAALYDQHVAICDAAMRGPKGDDALGGAWYVPSTEFWLSHQVARQRAILPQLKELDAAAVQQLEKALSAMA